MPRMTPCLLPVARDLAPSRGVRIAQALRAQLAGRAVFNACLVALEAMSALAVDAAVVGDHRCDAAFVQRLDIGITVIPRVRGDERRPSRSQVIST